MRDEVWFVNANLRDLLSIKRFSSYRYSVVAPLPPGLPPTRANRGGGSAGAMDIRTTDTHIQYGTPMSDTATASSTASRGDSAASSPQTPDHGSRIVVVAAILANVAIAVIKFGAALLSGSSGMLSEAIHSLVDTGDGLVLWVGMRRSRLPADDLHPFGHGMELYFWTLVVAMLVFSGGGGMSIYQGMIHMLHPREIEHVGWTYGVIGASAVFEGFSWVFAWRHFTRERGRRGIWETVESSKDPSKFAILFEDTAALVGLALAFLGVWLERTLGSPLPDALASIGIGLVLIAVAVVLARSTLRLLAGQSTDRETVQSIRALTCQDPDVEKVGRVLTVHFGPANVVAQIEVVFARSLSAEQVARAVDRLQATIRSRHPSLKNLFVEPATHAS